jgi:hypothetical protein
MALREQATVALRGIKQLLQRKEISRDRFYRDYVASLPDDSRLGDTRFFELMDKKDHLAGAQNKSLRALVAAWCEWRRDQCPPCKLAKAVRALFAPESERQIVPGQYMGEYRSYNCANTGRIATRHPVFIEPCTVCDNVRFRVVRKDKSESCGGVYFHNQFIHILVVERNYMPKVVLYAPPDINVAPLAGLALWSQSSERPDPSASRVLFVKLGSALANRFDLETYVEDKLKNQSELPGCIPIFGTDPITTGETSSGE